MEGSEHMNPFSHIKKGGKTNLFAPKQKNKFDQTKQNDKFVQMIQKGQNLFAYYKNNRLTYWTN